MSSMLVLANATILVMINSMLVFVSDYNFNFMPPFINAVNQGTDVSKHKIRDWLNATEKKVKINSLWT